MHLQFLFAKLCVHSTKDDSLRFSPPNKLKLIFKILGYFVNQLLRSSAYINNMFFNISLQFSKKQPVQMVKQAIHTNTPMIQTEMLQNLLTAKTIKRQFIAMI